MIHSKGKNKKECVREMEGAKWTEIRVDKSIKRKDCRGQRQVRNTTYTGERQRKMQKA